VSAAGFIWGLDYGPTLSETFDESAIGQTADPRPGTHTLEKRSCVREINIEYLFIWLLTAKTIQCWSA